IGNVSFYDSNQPAGIFQKPYGEETARLIDEEVRRIVEEQYTRAQGLIRSHRPQLERLAALLLEKEVAYKEDLEKILGGRPGKSELPETMIKANIAAS
ncbi:MAG TPA: hypothetical protein VG737_16015, partial [Cyclobacteriaceae bacterium]|nr:hypothetical protein [Cyclobacteriaceae bacterium]